MILWPPAKNLSSEARRFLFVGISSVEFTGSSTDKQTSFTLRPLRLRGECNQFYALLNNSIPVWRRTPFCSEAVLPFRATAYSYLAYQRWRIAPIDPCSIVNSIDQTPSAFVKDGPKSQYPKPDPISVFLVPSDFGKIGSLRMMRLLSFFKRRPPGVLWRKFG